MNTQRFDWTDATVAKAAELYHLGLSARVIGERIGVSRNAVIGKMNRHPDLFGGRATVPSRSKEVKQVEARKHPVLAHRGKKAFTPEMVVKAMREWKKGTPAAQIGEIIGKTEKQLLCYASTNRSQFPSRQRGRPAKGPRMVRTAEPEYIAPQFLVAPEGYDAERMEHAKPLHALEATECHWPLGNGGPFLFCAAEKHGRSPYCHHHFLRSLPKARAE